MGSRILAPRNLLVGKESNTFYHSTGVRAREARVGRIKELPLKTAYARFVLKNDILAVK